MQAIEIQNGKLVLVTRPVPKPGKGQVLVRVHTCSVNRPDILQRRGLYPPPPGVTDIPGLDIAGEIDGTGEKICALVPGGGYAEWCVADRALCLPLPRGYSFAKAAALPEALFTAWRNLVDVGGLKKGETILIHGGSSGVGTMAIQIAKAIGAIPIATAGTEAKCAAVRRLGTRHAINYKMQDFVAETLAATKGRGVDLVLDMVGGDYLARNLAVLAPLGRHVSIAVMKGRMAQADLVTIMMKRLTLTGSVLRSAPVKEKAVLARAVKKPLWPLLASGKIRPVIDRTLPLEQAQAAHELLEAGSVIGKIVLKVG
jgi:NADPH:quinone reductase